MNEKQVFGINYAKFLILFLIFMSNLFFSALTFRLVLDPKPPVDKNGLFSGGGSQGASCLHWRKVKKVVMLKAPSAELKSMWQNLLERQMSVQHSPLIDSLNSMLN